MKILFLIDNLGSGGAQRQMTTIACLLKNRAYDVSFLVYSEENFFRKCLVDNNIQVVTISSKNVIGRMFRIRKFIRNGNYDVVISFMDVPNFLNCFAAIGGHRWKVITSERSAKQSTFKNRKNKVFNWFQRFSDVIICNSLSSHNLWRLNYSCFEEKLKVIYNTVRISNLTSPYTPLNNGKINIVIAASYQGLKNPVGVVKALSLLSDEERNRFKIDWYGRKDVDLIAGTRVYEESLKLVQNNCLEGIIQLHGPTKDIHNRMLEADFVGLFSTVEGLPNVICEAMTIGKPVVMTKVSDYNVFVDDKNGVICDKITPDSIAEALRQVLRYSLEEIITMGTHSHEKSKKLFDSELIINQWIQLITNL